MLLMFVVQQLLFDILRRDSNTNTTGRYLSIFSLSLSLLYKSLSFSLLWTKQGPWRECQIVIMLWYCLFALRFNLEEIEIFEHELPRPAAIILLFDYIIEVFIGNILLYYIVFCTWSTVCGISPDRTQSQNPISGPVRYYLRLMFRNISYNIPFDESFNT